MALRLNGSSSGYVELDVPAAAGSHTLTLPDGGGSSGQYLQTNGSGGLSWQTVAASNLTLGTAQSLNSQTTITFALPTGVKKATLVWHDMSTSGAYNPRFRLGTSSSILTTGYRVIEGAQWAGASTGTSANSVTTGFLPTWQTAAAYYDGQVTFYNPSADFWIGDGHMVNEGAGYRVIQTFGGRINLSGELRQIELGITGGTFDDGQIRLYYEV